MAPVLSALSASAWVTRARGVVGPRIDTSEESRPTPGTPAFLLDGLATLDPPHRREVAAPLRSMAETMPLRANRSHGLGSQSQGS
ncbi:MAG: hypothetical protein QOE72_4218 [Chloroflexota bacterium]|jgi:hypothetical protein|nr:hypothetical protein [Chloroflexota bacterium]